MWQEYDKYNEEDHKVWSILFNRQKEIFDAYFDSSFVEGIKEIGFVADHIPNYTDVSDNLKAITGWQINVVPNIVPDKEFFELLSDKKFPCTAWIRKMKQLDYLEEPDMFHDCFGHLPLLTDQNYCDFLQGLSKIALEYVGDADAIDILSRIYWYTIEFGLKKENGKLKIYGSGILSSNGESRFCMTDDVPKYSFDVEKIMNTTYYKHDYQEKYFVIESYGQLYNSLEDIRAILKKMLTAKEKSVNLHV